MTNKKDNSIISLLDYKKKKAEKQTSSKPEDSPKIQAQTKAPIVYMSNYLKNKKIPDLKYLQGKQNESVFSIETKEESNNLIILDQYRKEKNKKRIWKKQVQFYTKEALSVSGLAFLFLFTFNLAVSIQSNTPSQASRASAPKTNIVRGESYTEKTEQPSRIYRKIAHAKAKDEALPRSHKDWGRKIQQMDREKVILGRKPSSSDYTGF